MPQRVPLAVTDDGGSTPPPCAPLALSRGWYALRLQPNHEFRVERFLAERGLEAYLPTFKERVRWSDREIDAVRKLFPGYIFVRDGNFAEYLLALSAPGVVQALPTNLEPSLIDEREIENLKLALERGRDAKPAAQCPYVAGERVTIDRGPLAGVEGIVTRTAGVFRVFVNVTLLNRAVSVGVDAADLKH